MNGPTVSDLATLRAVIARSQIYEPASQRQARRLPPGFDAADLAVLEWIAGEARRAGRWLAVM